MRRKRKQCCRSCGTTEPECFYESNPGLCKQCYRNRQKIWRKQNPIRTAKIKHESYLRRKEKAREESRSWREKNLGRRQLSQRKWREENLGERLRKERAYRALPQVQLRCRLHGSIKSVFGVPPGKVGEKELRILFYRRLFMLVESNKMSLGEAQITIKQFDVNPYNTLLSLYQTVCCASVLKLGRSLG